MDYAIQMCVNQASGPPKVVSTKIEQGRPLDEVIMIAKAHLKTAGEPDGKIITDEGPIVVGPDAVFVRVVEIEDGSPTGRVVFP
jgi:hypothetical protein